MRQSQKQRIDRQTKDKQKHFHKHTSSSSSTATPKQQLRLMRNTNYHLGVNRLILSYVLSPSVFVYPAKEAHNKKSKLKLQHSGSIQCILWVLWLFFVPSKIHTELVLISSWVHTVSKWFGIQKNLRHLSFRYVDNQVFISLSTGDLYIYRRQPGKIFSGW